MNATANEHNWTTFLKIFNEQNNNRPTRLGVFERKFEGETADYWIESGLPLIGVDVDTSGAGVPNVEIILGNSKNGDSRHLTHTVQGARQAKIVLSSDGTADGLEIEDAEVKTTVLRFES